MTVNQDERASLIDHLVNRQAMLTGVMLSHTMRPRAMPLTRMSMKKDIHGFPISIHGFL